MGARPGCCEVVVWASPLICLSGQGRINHCPLLGEEGTVNKVAFGWAWKCRQAPSPLCRNQWASGLRLPQPHQANATFPWQGPQPLAPQARAQAPLTRCCGLEHLLPAAHLPCSCPRWPPFVPSVPRLVTAAWYVPVMVSLGRSKCGGAGVSRLLSPDPMCCPPPCPASTLPSAGHWVLLVKPWCAQPSCSLGSVLGNRTRLQPGAHSPAQLVGGGQGHAQWCGHPGASPGPA